MDQVPPSLNNRNVNEFKPNKIESLAPKDSLPDNNIKKILLIFFIAAVIIGIIAVGGFYLVYKNAASMLGEDNSLSLNDVMLTPDPLADIRRDSDSDGLSDKIENVIGTYSDKADSDGDSFTDLQEIKSGYSPLIVGTIGQYTQEDWNIVKGKIKIEDNEFYKREFEVVKEFENLKSYRNDQYGFEIMYPNDWETIDKMPAIMSFAKSADIKTKNPEELFFIQMRVADRKPEKSFIEQIKGKTGNNPELRKMNGKDFYYAKNQLMGITFYEYSLENKNKIFQIIGLIFLNVENIENENDIVYITDEELSEELNVLNKMVSSFNFSE